jgi:hypothetical protein
LYFIDWKAVFWWSIPHQQGLAPTYTTCDPLVAKGNETVGHLPYSERMDTFSTAFCRLEKGLAEEETVGEYTEDKTSEERILPVALDESKIEYRSQDTDKGCQH